MRMPQPERMRLFGQVHLPMTQAGKWATLDASNETEVSMSKIALVTGANKGIGFETVRQLAKAGVHTILASRDSAKGATAVQKLKAEGLDVEMLTLDVNDPAMVFRTDRRRSPNRKWRLGARLSTPMSLV
jgi:hypothetical protein